MGVYRTAVSVRGQGSSFDPWLVAAYARRVYNGRLIARFVEGGLFPDTTVPVEIVLTFPTESKARNFMRAMRGAPSFHVQQCRTLRKGTAWTR